MRREFRLMPQRQVVLNLVLGALLNFPAIAIGQMQTADRTKDCFCKASTAICHSRTCPTGDVFDGCGCWNNDGNGKGSSTTSYGWNTKKQRCKKGQTTDTVASSDSSVNEVTACDYSGWSVVTSRRRSTSGGSTSGGSTSVPKVDCVGHWLVQPGAYDAVAASGSITRSCDKACGGGRQTSEFFVSTAAKNGGKACQSVHGDEKFADCNTAACAVDCRGQWGPWMVRMGDGTMGYGTCSSTCGRGMKMRTYSITQVATGGGEDCKYKGYGSVAKVVRDGQEYWQACVVQPQVCGVDCQGSWSGWSEPADCCASTASTSCTPRRLTSTYSIQTAGNTGGAACEAVQGQLREKDAGTMACAVDCEGHWANEEPSMGTCTGYDSRCGHHNGVLVNTANPGFEMETLRLRNNESETSKGWRCHRPGAVDRCQIGPMTESQCDPTGCGYGTESPTCDCRFRVEGDDPASQFYYDYSGTGGWGACMVRDGPTMPERTCGIGWPEPGYGRQTRTFIVTTPAANNGKECMHNNNEKEGSKCAATACPRDCIGAWVGPAPAYLPDAWTACTATCGGGLRTQEFRITQQPEGGGNLCSNSEGDLQSQSCNEQPCPVDCEGSWHDWSACPASCGTNLALGKVPTGSSESTFGPYAGATDGKFGSMKDKDGQPAWWHAGNGDYPSYLVLDLGRPSVITSMEITVGEYGFGSLSIFGSDDSGTDESWALVRSHADASVCQKGAGQKATYSGWARPVVSVKIAMADRCAGHHFSIVEWEVYGLQGHDCTFSGPHDDAEVSGCSKGCEIHATLAAAQAACSVEASCGGITYRAFVDDPSANQMCCDNDGPNAGMCGWCYELRSGGCGPMGCSASDLIVSQRADTSWIKSGGEQCAGLIPHNCVLWDDGCAAHPASGGALVQQNAPEVPAALYILQSPGTACQKNEFDEEPSMGTCTGSDSRCGHANSVKVDDALVNTANPDWRCHRPGPVKKCQIGPMTESQCDPTGCGYGTESPDCDCRFRVTSTNSDVASATECRDAAASLNLDADDSHDAVLNAAATSTCVVGGRSICKAFYVYQSAGTACRAGTELTSELECHNAVETLNLQETVDYNSDGDGDGATPDAATKTDAAIPAGCGIIASANKELYFNLHAAGRISRNVRPICKNGGSVPPAPVTAASCAQPGVPYCARYAGGSQSRTYSIATPPAHGGAACPDESTRECALQQCLRPSPPPPALDTDGDGMPDETDPDDDNDGLDDADDDGPLDPTVPAADSGMGIECSNSTTQLFAVQQQYEYLELHNDFGEVIVSVGHQNESQSTDPHYLELTTFCGEIAHLAAVSLNESCVPSERTCQARVKVVEGPAPPADQDIYIWSKFGDINEKATLLLSDQDGLCPEV